MRKPEQKLWDAMRANKPVGIKLERVENGLGSGMPDVYCRSQNFATWVELKVGGNPKRADTRLLGKKGLRIEQINWHLESASKGLQTFILVKGGDSRNAPLWLIAGEHANVINSLPRAMLDRLALAQSWDWIFMILMQGETAA